MWISKIRVLYKYMIPMCCELQYDQIFLQKLLTLCYYYYNLVQCKMKLYSLLFCYCHSLYNKPNRQEFEKKDFH